MKSSFAARLRWIRPREPPVPGAGTARGAVWRGALADGAAPRMRSVRSLVGHAARMRGHVGSVAPSVATHVYRTGGSGAAPGGRTATAMPALRGERRRDRQDCRDEGELEAGESHGGAQGAGMT